MQLLRITIAIAFVAMITGCATVDPRESFESTADVVGERTGLAPGWARDEKARQDIEERVEELLARPLTADRAAQIALLHSPQLQADLEELGIAQADLAQATRLPNPRFEISYEESDEGDDSRVEWSLIDDLLGAALTPLRKRIAEAELERVKLEAGQAMLDLVAETRVAFYEYQAAEQLVGRLELIRDLAQAAAELARRQRSAGTASELAAVQQEALYADTSIQLIAAQRDARSAREAVERLLGLSGPETAWEAVPELPSLPPAEPSFVHLERLAVERRLDLAAGRYAVDAVARALALRRGTRWFPAGIHVGVSHEEEEDTRLTGPVLAIELPLFDTGAASIARLEAFHRRAQHQLDALAVAARSDVREARDRLIASRAVVEAYRDALLPQRLKILDETQRRYNMMLEGVYELILASQQHVAAERAYIESWRDYWVARTDLERAAGGALPVAAGDPAASREPPESQGPEESASHPHHGGSR